MQFCWLSVVLCQLHGNSAFTTDHGQRTTDKPNRESFHNVAMLIVDLVACSQLYHLIICPAIAAQLTRGSRRQKGA